MARTVDFGDYYGTVSFPDDATDDDVLARYNDLEDQRNRAVQLSRLKLEQATDEVERQQPTLGKIATLAGLNLREGAAGTTQQAVGNIARTVSDIFSTQERNEMRANPAPPGYQYVRDPEAPLSILRQAGMDIEQAGTRQLQEAQELSEGVGGGLAGKITAGLASTAGASAPALLAAPLGLPAAALAGGVQSYGSNLSNFRDMIQARNPGMTEEEAFQQAQVPAAITGAATAVLTRTFGGVERFVDRIAKEGLKQTGVKALLREGFKNASLEMPEEGLDQLAQGLTEKALINPDKDIGEILNDAGMAGLTGFALGGITTGAIAAPVKAAEVVAGAIESSRVRRQSARESEARVKQVVQEREAQDATTSGTSTQTPGQEEAPVQEAGGGVRVRDTPQAGVETQAGTKVADFGGYQYGLPMYTIPGVRPGIVRHVSAETAQKAGYTVPATIPTMEEWQASGSPIDTAARAPAEEDVAFWQNKKQEVQQQLQQVMENPVRDNATQGRIQEQKAQINRLNAELKRIDSNIDYYSRSPAPAGTPQNPISIQIQKPDGTTQPGQFTGWYMPGRPSIGRILENGKVSHGMLAAGESIIGEVPSFEQWQAERDSAAAPAVPTTPQSRVVPQTETPEFKRWFSGSKIVDGNGKPFVVYHGTPSSGSFSPYPVINKFNTPSYFHPDPKVAGRYGDSIYPVYLSLKNIASEAVFHQVQDMHTTLDGTIEQLEKMGYDGAYGTWSKGEIIAFNPESIKSAIGNRGAFDPNNPDIAAAPAVPTTPQEQAQAPINWQEFATRDSEGYNAIDLPKIRENLITGKIQGGTVNNQLLTYLLRDSSLHPLNPIRLIDLGPQQLQAISDPASPAGQGAYRGLFTTRTLSNKGNIEILTQNSDGTPVSQAAFVQTLAHELVHNNITSKINQASPELRQEAQNIFNFVKNRTSGWEGTNALSNIDEFFSEAMTDPEFQKFLSGLDYGPSRKAKIRRSAFSAIMDLIKRIFRLPDFITTSTGQKVDMVTVLEQVFSTAGQLEQVQRYSQQALLYGPIISRAPAEDTGRPQQFQTRQQVEATVSNPGLDAAQQQEVRDLAAVQSSMSPDNLALWLMGTPVNEAEGFAQRKLSYIEDRRHLSDMQRDLASMPETTPEEIRAKEVAGATILGHYGVDRGVLRESDADLEKAQNQMALAAKKITGLNNNQLKANFLTALFNHLTSDYRTYLGNLAQTIPANQNAQALYRQRLVDAERRLNEHEQSPIAIQRALSALAAAMPNNLTTNQRVVDWELRNNSTMGVVSDNVRLWMFIDDGSGSPALLGYTRLLQDMSDLKDVLAHQGTLASEIDSFEKWFRTSGKTGKVSAKNFAEKYFKLRTARDRAMKVASAIDKEINDLDTRIHGNIIAGDRLRELMASPAYVDTVRDAAQRAHVVVRAIHEQGEKTGLIERDKAVGQWKMRGPISGQEYVVDLHPSSVDEVDNRGKLKAFAQEARDYSATNAQTDPLLADEYESLADYIDKYLVHPALDPSQGFTQLPWINVPGTNIRVTTDPFAWTAKTVRDTLEKIGGRSVRQAVLDAAELDTVMQQVQGINNNKEYGYAAQTQAILAALESHGWSTELFPEWDEKIAEKVLASGQNNVSPLYQVGDTVVGSGEVLTSEDIKAMRIMKRWEDAVLAVAPKHIKDRIADLGIVRKAVGNGQYTMARTAAPWVQNFMLNWNKATTDADKLKLLSNDNLFRRIVLGYVSEFNPEFAKMNPASKEKTPLFEIFRRMARLEKEGVQSFSNLNDVLDFTAGEMVARDMAPDHVTAKAKAGEMLLTDIKNFIGSFQENVLNKKTEDVWGDVPPAVVQASSANNSFTIPRGALVAPSTFYSYSTASDGRRAVHVGSLRSFLNLKLLQSGYEARRALEAKKSEMDDRIKELLRSGKTKAQAREVVIKETARSRKASEIQFDYLELNHALGLLEKTFDQLERFESSTTEHYQHGGVAALMNVFGTLKSFLLSSPQAVTTNYWSGVMLGPAIAHLQTGRIGRALTDFVIEPHFWGTIYRRLSAAVAGNPVMASLLKKHAPLWNSFSKEILTAAEDWRRIEEIAQNSGMVSPYNLKQNLANKRALAATGSRLESAEEMATLRQSTEAVNTILGSGRHVIERVKATTPRLFDNFINYALITAFEYETDFLKKMGWVAFKNREEQAAMTGTDWTDLSDPDNVLTPGDLRLGTSKALNRYREWFAGIGSLDQVLFEFYQRTKNMTPEQRREEPLIPDLSEHAAVALQYAATTNVATETNRPYLFKGKGSDGLWRNVAGTFMGWPINMAKQLSKAIQSHSKDPQFTRIASNMIGLAMLVMLFSLGGAWNWEFGDELTELLFNQSSARIQPGNVMRSAQEGDLETAAMYFVQGLVNTVPLIGGAIGNLGGVAYTGRGNLFDMSSWNPVLGWISDTWNTGKRIIQTGDVTLPMLDYARRWVPLSKVAINRLPLMRGLVDQQNVIRSLNASAPPGTEIVWGQGGMGALRYGPANDEIQKLIASAYEAVAHGGSLAQVEQRRAEAIAAFVRAGRTEEDATKAVDAALAAKEPIRVLTGKEFTEEEAAKWIARMTPAQKKDYDRAVAAWEVLGAVTGKDLNMVATARGSGGGGGIPSIAALSAGIPSIGQGMGAAMPRMASQAPARGYSGYLRQPSLGGSRVRSPLGRRRSAMRIRRRRVGATRRRLGPRVARGRVRRVLGTRRRRSYSVV